VLSLRTSVFTSQVGKLSDVHDALLIDVIHFYSDLGTLQQVFDGVNELGVEFNRTDRYSIQMATLGEGLRKLRAKLPPAEAAK
jgi:hypothetical protein